ncbi:FAD-linked oxidoreductase sorD [Colletotrichum orbiculare MAFF 240422]|uniref:FAD-linked oxidoreductase sorD n=1 Tax=Colletotrichum orbiculare (strain 104-T / ATCC 96160 / CBS 514.97 / LARS 414 / MAFF 240422) TaxID=1213857 RepID=N4VB44_COLOR|nr:FAD-linked oxidoreductase sorD [Colletotrichum orbiculare MAFF 240422]
MRSYFLLSLATAAIPLGAANPLPQDASTNAKVSKNSLAGCLKAANVPYSTSSSSDWSVSVQSYNTRVSFTPAAVVTATDPSHVSSAVKCGTQYGYKVTGRGGGHSYSSAGFGGENGHVVVQLNQMYGVTLQDDNTAVVQAGARLGHVAAELFNQGGRAISHGSCPGVGISGHSLHGGYGFSSHMYGLAVDWIIEATVVLAGGKVVTCSTTQNADLFWALRGAGSSFGIVTQFKLNTFQAPDVVTVFNLPVALTKQDKIAKMLTAYQKYARDTMPKELNMAFKANPDGLSFVGLYFGDEDETRDVLQSFVDSLKAGLDLGPATITQTDWIGQLEHYGGDPLDVTGPQSATDTFYASSLVTKEVSSFTDFAGYLSNKAKTVQRGWFVLIDVHGGKNSATAQADASSTSYAHRDKLFLWQFYDSSNGQAYPANARQGTSFIGDWMATVTGKTAAGSWGRYINYADSLLGNADAQNQYWMGNLARLRAIKAQYDPKGVFTYPQGVGS